MCFEAPARRQEGLGGLPPLTGVRWIFWEHRKAGLFLSCPLVSKSSGEVTVLSARSWNV